jgi:CheY-like chemotaxis protein
MNNAIKFTKKGSVTLEIEKTKQINHKINLLFRIIDTGTGISEEGQKRLFQEFSQTDISITRKYGGTGLGLIISKKLSKLMGGEIGVESKIGKGSTFWFTVVLETGSEIKKESEKKSMKEEQKIKKRLSILVAEDNVINQKVAMINLKQLGHDVEIAVNGKMAVDMYSKNKYDLILMDIQMPVLDGIEATKEIRKIEKENNVSDKIKIVAITANAMKEDKNKCLSAGMDDYITKPFKSEDMERALIID